MIVASHVHVDSDVVNNDMTSDVSAPALRLQETRNPLYIEGDRADYLCSITRFSIQTGSSLPVFIPRIELGQEDVNKTVYAITLKIDGQFGGEKHEFTQAIQYIPMDSTVPNPAQPLERQDLSSTYYYMYNYVNVIDMLNANLGTAMTQLTRLFENASDRAHIQTYATPFFEIDPDTYKMVLDVDKRIFEVVNTQIRAISFLEIYI